MLTESIKALLGAELSAQVEAALKGHGKDGRDVDLVVGNDGSYVPADKYNGAQSASQSAAAALKAAADALRAIGGSGDPAKLASDVAAAKASVDQMQRDYAEKVRTLSRQTAVRLALAADAQDPADILPLLDLSKIEVDDAGNLRTDLAPMLDPIRTAKPYLFRPKDPSGTPTISGAAPAPNQSGAGDGGKLTPEQVAGLSYADYKAWRAKNP